LIYCGQDEDFVAEKDDAGSPTDDSEAEEPDASDDAGGGGSEVWNFNFIWS
jgi:structure-specific recognition protein 1